MPRVVPLSPRLGRLSTTNQPQGSCDLRSTGCGPTHHRLGIRADLEAGEDSRHPSGPMPGQRFQRHHEVQEKLETENKGVMTGGCNGRLTLIPSTSTARSRHLRSFLRCWVKLSSAESEGVAYNWRVDDTTSRSSRRSCQTLFIAATAGGATPTPSVPSWRVVRCALGSTHNQPQVLGRRVLG